jgi:hypothetical protein
MTVANDHAQNSNRYELIPGHSLLLEIINTSLAAAWRSMPSRLCHLSLLFLSAHANP